MREVINVSIAGIAFKLDDDAYRMLNDYLDKINRHYSSMPDGNEIIEDIEARIAEIILSKQDSSLVVTAQLISRVVSQLGMPEEIGNHTGNSENVKDLDADNETGTKFPRRLYRNPFNAKLGGVCSGLATYFNVDVTLVRLFFLSPIILGILLSILFNGYRFSDIFRTLGPAFSFIYLVMWVVIPKAKTPRQFLEMKGEKITSSRIERIFIEEFRGMGNSNVRSSVKMEKSASILTRLLGVLGKIILFFIYTVLALVGLMMLVALIYVLITGIKFFTIGSHNLVFGAMTGPLYALVLMVLVVIILPLVVGIYSIVKQVLSLGWNKNFLYIATIGWLAAFLSCAVIYYSYFHNNNYEVKLKNIKVEGRSFHNEKKERKIKFERNNMQFFITEITHDFRELTSVKGIGDTLHIMPMDTLRPKGFRSVPVNFIWGNTKYKQPTVEIKRTYNNMLWNIIRDRKLPEMSPVEFRYVNDTLYVHNFFKTRYLNEYAQIDVYLPEDMKIDVDENIRFYEFIYWD
ncbi:MAG: PspC domain-containing protein [Rikenellaceae bacterium]|nr:PspC domain-containing protein [Rikenellaceae bacterium]